MIKQEILEKIEHLFYQKSFREVSMQDIADLLNMKKASLYYHFPSKEHILQEVVEYSFWKYLYFINSVISDFNWENFRELFTKFIEYPKKSQNLFAIINQNWYCESLALVDYIKKLQKQIFENIFKKLNSEMWFSREKTYLFLALIQSISKETCIYGQCEIDNNKVIDEIQKLFII